MSEEVYYTQGEHNVEHRNVGASGEEHPFGDEPKEWTADLRPLIRQFADDLYDSWEETLREYLANAETACLKVDKFNKDSSLVPYDDMIVEDNYEPRIVVEYDQSKQKVIIQDNGIGMNAKEVREVFSHIGRSATRDMSDMTGSFGIGVLSFLKFIGVNNSTMIMLSNSRLSSDNAAYLVSLAGVEPIMGQLGDEEYGTKFKLDQKNSDMDVRSAVEKYSQWMRVPVLYRELDENGKEVFNEDWGGKRLYESYERDNYMDRISEPGFFEAYMSPDANDRVLLQSMPINKSHSTTTMTCPYPFDTRITDESGAIVVSSNGNKGLTPVSRSEYDQMLINARDEYIAEHLLSNKDITAQKGRVDGEVVYHVSEEVLDSDEPLPLHNYVTDSSEVDEFGPKEVIAGPNKGRVVVDRSEWNSLPEGRAEGFIPRDEVEDFNIDSEQGDLCLPKPATDRETLQDNKVFWKYLSHKFTQRFDQAIQEYRQSAHSLEDLEDMNPHTKEHVVTQMN